MRRTAFTLIELLVVIAIIAVLVSILLPALAGARGAGQAVVCLANQRQISLANINYAMDYGVIPGTYWQGPVNLDWAGRNNIEYRTNRTLYDHPLETSVLYDYFETTDAILECPSVKRQANQFFDYTMIIRMAGAKIETDWPVRYLENPRFGARSPKKRFQSMPIIVEEDTRFYNGDPRYDDGSWAGDDQFTHRHGGNANIAYLDGSAGTFDAPKGASELSQEPEDLTARHLSVLFRGRDYSLWGSSAQEFGWINSPR